MRRVALLALCLPLLLAVGCDSGGAMPTAAELHGLWANETDGQVRAFEFESGTADVYRIYVYDAGAEPVEVQRGTYEVAYGRLVTHVSWSTDASLIGRDFGNDIVDFTGHALVLGVPTAPSGERVYTRVDALP